MWTLRRKKEDQLEDELRRSATRWIKIEKSDQK